MCGLLGETIAAPPVVLPHDDGVIGVLEKCWVAEWTPEQELMLDGAVFHQERPAAHSFVSAPREATLAVWTFKGRSGEFLHCPASGRTALPLGYGANVYRPPRHAPG